MDFCPDRYAGGGQSMKTEIGTIDIKPTHTTFQGSGVEILRLASLINGLRLELRCPGLKLSRRGSALNFAKRITGLRTNNRIAHIARLEIMLAEAKRHVIYTQED
jgi:hypothetical protein